MIDLNGNTLMIIAAIGGAIVMLFPKLKPFWDKIKPLIPSTQEKEVLKDKSVSLNPLDDYSVHEIVEYLLAKAKTDGDKDGVMLIGTYGKHVYDLKIGV